MSGELGARYGQAVALLTAVSLSRELPPPSGGYAVGNETMAAIRRFLDSVEIPIPEPEPPVTS